MTGRQPNAAARHLIGVRVDDDELERLSAAADIRNTTPASYLREQGLEAPPPRQARRLSADTVILGRVLAEMGHIGSNVNQIARVLNARGDVAMHDINEAMQEVTGLSRVIRTALGRKPRP